jgi:hypothetical protein
MAIKLDDPRLSEPGRPKLPPQEYAGEWIVWNKERTQVVAHGPDMVAVHRAAIAAGDTDPLLEKVHRPDRIYVGWL